MVKGTSGSVVAGFLGGVLTIPLVHQPLVWAMQYLGWSVWSAYSVRPTAPFGIPEVASACFWGGVWSALFWRWSARGLSLGSAARRGATLGATLPNLVGAALILLGKDKAELLGWQSLAAALLINGAWGAAAMTASYAIRWLPPRRLWQS